MDNQTRRPFMLECGQLQAIPMPYSYVRRAQSTTHRINYQQTAMSKDKGELIAFYQKHYAPIRFSGRIIDWETGETVFKKEF
jgi:hypothetical protein